MGQFQGAAGRHAENGTCLGHQTIGHEPVELCESRVGGEGVEELGSGDDDSQPAPGVIDAIVLDVHNGHAESINSRITMIKTRSCGFRNKTRFRNAIYFHLGGLVFYPKGEEL